MVVFRDFEPPLTSAACKAVSLGNAGNCRLRGPKKSVMKLHVNWGHASTQQMKRVLADSEGGNLHLVASANEELAQREVCQAFDRAPHVPAAGTSIVAMLSEKLLADLLFLGDIIALQTMDPFSTYSLLIRVRTKNPRVDLEFFRSS